uniref:Trehalose 6-phosphate phosphatase n=1 Tax=Tamarix hispida TaxID=189793 RepID=A0A2S0SJV2_9CARY|nr:trehalose-6-phosphate phosphatase A [Tamarix hispida]
MTKQNPLALEAESGIGTDMAVAAGKPKSSSGVGGGGCSAHKPPPGPCGGKFAMGSAAMAERMVLKDLEINGPARINSWVDSMRASSPTHIKSTASSLSANGDDHTNSADWTGNLASALAMFDEILKQSEGKQIFMFSDYDGTLSPIVDDPDRAFMSVAMRRTLRKVAKYFPTAIVTGRCRDKVYNFVRLAELYYAGSHGMDIKGPTKPSKSKHMIIKGSDGSCIGGNSQAVEFQPASEFIPMINEVYEALMEKTNSIFGCKVEHNKFCVSVHFRCVDEKRWSEVAQEVRSVLKQYPKLRLTQGRKVLEIRPIIRWDKGMALEFLLESLGLDNCTDVFPVYIGDDRSDEDAFKVLRERKQGCGILVSRFPKNTNASYYLREPAEVLGFLRRLVKWKRCSLRTQSSQ